ncbi:MAG TPA: L-threonylcarbamoyladenylate synthase [Dehalococcoidia bacterium]|nr:L-threonylcarbamoyladenylate synthase [Dehalococcoidia bacterium]
MAMAEIVPMRDPRALDYAVSALKVGELVVYPTDTQYGLGALAGNDVALRALFAAKGRAPSKALPLLIADSKMAAWVAEETPVAHMLMAGFWPGALTIVMRRKASFHSLALAGGDTVALRVPDYDFARDMIGAAGEPVVGTSANRSGGRGPASAAEAAFALGDMVALVIDGGRLTGTASTVIDITQEGGPVMVREGVVSKAEIEAVLGRGPAAVKVRVMEREA